MKDRGPSEGYLEWSEAKDSREWDEFVIRNGGSVFQLWSWRRILESDGSRPLYLACRDPQGRILAVCPFFYREGRVLKYLESLPDGQTAGPLVGEQSLVESQIIASMAKSVKFSLSNPVIALIVNAHQQKTAGLLRTLGFQERSMRSGILALDLQEKTPEHIWSNGFKKHDRQAVKYYQEGVRFELSYIESKYLALERPDWLRFKGKLFHADYISRMMAILGNRAKVALVVDSNNKPLAGALLLLDHPRSPSPWVHMRAIRYSIARNIHSVVTFINWEVINWANANGYTFVDFGLYSITRSLNPAHGFYKLKKRFELMLMPTYQFTLPTSDLSYSIAKRLSRIA